MERGGCLDVTFTHKPTMLHSDPHETTTKFFVHGDNLLHEHEHKHEHEQDMNMNMAMSLYIYMYIHSNTNTAIDMDVDVEMAIMTMYYQVAILLGVF